MSLRRRVAALALAAGVALAGCAGLRGPGSDAKLDVLSYAIVGDRLVGELVDRGPSNADALRVEVAFTDADGRVVLHETLAPWRVLLVANETSLFDAKLPAGATDATLRAVGETTRQDSAERQHLRARDVRTQHAEADATVAFEGFAQNDGEIAVQGVEVQVAFHDAAGHLVGAARVIPASPGLAPGAASRFAGSTLLAGDFARADATVVTTLATR